VTTLADVVVVVGACMINDWVVELWSLLDFALVSCLRTCDIDVAGKCTFWACCTWFVDESESIGGLAEYIGRLVTFCMVFWVDDADFIWF
jgi:hypothetical protein